MIPDPRRCQTCPPDDICHATQRPCPLESRWIEYHEIGKRFPTRIYLRQIGQKVPNRLYGATINSEGDAI
jgi:hypothetical protein